ncbi:exported protein of unknown function [Sterolibacterium denitrificans]|uniref:Uncharacterized protein n=1 Tax=Sterolibacterium denitrificans TaxID=157592 RepID=A0A7Z7MUA5_9PROT|nr:exported protein of unknown function [Sterolibacterium denitrificans]
MRYSPFPLCLAEFRRRRAGLSGFVCLSAASLETGRSAAAKLGKPAGPAHRQEPEGRSHP